MLYLRIYYVCFAVCALFGFALPSLADDAATPFVYVCRDAGAGGYQAFPDVCRLQDGRLMCAFYASYHHIGLPRPENPKGGRISYCLSNDEGRTWSEAVTLFDSPDDDRDPSLVQLKNGRLICNFFSLHRNADRELPCPDPLRERYTATGTWILVSDDCGQSWSEPRKIYDWYASSPIRELSSGRLLMPLYAESDGNPPTAFGAVGASDDGGATWNPPVEIRNGGRHLDAETDVIELPNGRLWAAQRAADGPACYAISYDQGNRWSVSKSLDFVAHCPYLLRPASRPDRILFAYRGVDETGAVVTALRYSTDGCKTWSEPIEVDRFGGAYPSMVDLNDGSILIVYYEEGAKSSIRAKRFRVTDGGVEWLSF